MSMKSGTAWPPVSGTRSYAVAERRSTNRRARARDRPEFLLDVDAACAPVFQAVGEHAAAVFGEGEQDGAERRLVESLFGYSSTTTPTIAAVEAMVRPRLRRYVRRSDRRVTSTRA
jgi:hypothetical protein